MYRQPLCGNTTIAAALPHAAIPGGALPLQPRLSITSDGSSDTVTERSNDHMPNRQRNLGINIRVTPQEKKKIERNARKCKLTVSEYLRQLAMNIEPKELPSEEILRSIMRLQNMSARFINYSEASSSENSQKFYRNIANEIMQIQTETLQLMTHSDPIPEEKNNGND